jgi:Ca-activated chloride channel family protein
MRNKTVVAFLLGTSLLTSCKSADKSAPRAQPEEVMMADNTATAAGSSAMTTPTSPAPRMMNEQAKAGAAGIMADTKTGEAYHDWGKNPWVDASKDRLSTFAADVDTASYSIARKKLLDEGTLPPAPSVRVEEFVNAFKYKFAEPAGNTPFSVVMEAAPSPMQAGRTIVRVGVATKAKSTMERKPAHLVFLVDVSGSMSDPDKLPLAKEALKILTHNLTENDTVSLVTYAGSTRVLLEPTIDQK